jgi:cobalt-zinc-cadmium resistance protein CzcA
MIGKIVKFSLARRYLVLFLGLVFVIGGTIAFRDLPIEAYPDISDTWVQIITQWPGHAAEEMERQITVPLEIEMNSVPHHTALRSVSLFGISVVTIIFDEETAPFTARQYVLEKLPGVQLPTGAQSGLAGMFSSVGRVYWYTLESNRSVMELKELQDWELEKRLRAVPGVADVSSFGGTVKQFQVLVDPLALANYGLSTGSVVQALSNNNQNSGGGFIHHGDQTFNIRGVGKADGVEDLQSVIVTQKAGTPIRVRNVGQVVVGPQTRLGKISLSEHRADGTVEERDDVVEGIVFARKGERDEHVLKGLHAKIKELNEKYLPPDVKIKPHLDRSTLIKYTTNTVERNMVEGMILVLLVLLFFLGNVRSALIVAATIPLSLLFASIMLDLKNIPANLLSLGALDFGMIVDGAVVMIENIFRHKQNRKAAGGDPDGGSIIELIIAAAAEVERPIVYAIAIIILTYLPIFTLQRIEGRLFSPMAWTVAFALLGAMVLVITLLPVLASLFMKGEIKEWHNPFMHWIEGRYRQALTWALANRSKVFMVAGGGFALTLLLAFGGIIGSEFLPHLDEGSIWVRGTLPPSASYATSDQIVKKARAIFMKYPEVPITVCQMGRPDDGTDATGFFNTECFVDLKPRGQWRREFPTKEHLIKSMNAELSKIPGVIWNFSQPISDDVEEMMSGVKGALVVKVYGENLKVLTEKANEIKNSISRVPGVADLGIFEELGQPNVNIVINRDKISRYGLNISDVQDVIETAVGGKATSQIIEGEKRFDVVVRYQPQFRENVEQIRRIQVATPDGFRVPLEDLATIKVEDGASMIYREENARYIAVKFSVRGRDLGSTIDDAQRAVRRAVLLPEGYRLLWTGEFESQRRAEARLRLIVPLTIFAIFFVLFLVFGSLKWALIILGDVALARVGGVMALFLTGNNFSVSSGIGFLAVFGVSIQTGMLLVSYMNQMRQKGSSIRDAVIEGAILRLRPIMMTALVATFGLLPAAFSHDIGSDSQRPLAIVIVGGLITDLVMGFFLLPTLYLTFAKEGDKLGD